MDDPRAEYERRLAERRERIAALDRINLLLSNSRLIVAAAGAILLWLAFVRLAVSPAWPAGAGVVFGALMFLHARQLNRLERAQAAERVYVRGLDRLADRWAGAGRDGAAFAADHPYARDLDLFGPGSLFERLNTTRTEAGEATLASWLSGPAAAVEVQARQRAIDELRPMLDFREDVAVLASESPIGRTGLLAAWAQAPPTRFPAALPVLLAALAAVTVALAVGVYKNLVLPDLLVLWAAVSVGIAAIWRKPFHRVLHAIDTPDRDLGLVAELLARLESQRFTSPRLVALHAALMTAGVPPSKRIAALRALVSWLDSTHNLLFAPFAYVLLLRQQLAIAIARWHAAYGPAIAEWLRAIGEAEAFAAFATYAYERPADPFPELADGEAVFDAEGLSHPLIRSDIAVANDVRLGREQPHVIVLSG
ncbi:MAG TPA: hypothetical protein VNG89_25925, partial [Vicinamibacterales bacterium]|nr:hypothetical protein [Vicinamibacterales bacterium]